MTLTPMETLGIILAVTAGTQLTRWLPFWLFPEKKQPPAVVTYLGRVLPPAMMGLLVVYCLRNVSWLSAPPRGAGADRHRGGGGAAHLEAERAAVHRRGHCAVYGAGAGGVRLRNDTGQAEARPVFFRAVGASLFLNRNDLLRN